MSLAKAAMLMDETNRLYGAINSYNNTLPTSFDALASGYGITQSAVSVSHLTAAQKGELLKTATGFYLAIAKEMLSGSVFTNLRSVGYTGFNDAIADIPNHYAGAVQVIVAANFTKTKELFDTVFAQFSGYAPPTQLNYTDAGIVELLEKVITVKNKLVEVTPFFDKIGA